MNSFLEKIKNKTKNTLHAIHEEWQDLLYTDTASKIRQKTLLIIKVDSIGDYIIFRNFLSELKASKKFDGYKITLLGNVWYKDIAEEFDKNSVDEFIWVDLLELKNEDYFDEIVRGIFKQGFEYAFCPNYSMSLEDVKLLARSGAKNKISQNGDLININPEEKIKYAEDFTSIINIGERYDFEFYRYRDFFEKLIEEKVKVTDIKLPLEITEQKHIVICPGANALNRRWAPDNFAQLIDKYNEKFPGFNFYIVGSMQDKELGEQIINKANSKNIINECGKLNLIALSKLIASCSLMITNDTGPYHIAMALNKKTVCISNGNNYNRFTPYPGEFNRLSITVISKKVQELVKQPKEIINFQSYGSHENINEITVDNVLNEIEVLEKPM